MARKKSRQANRAPAVNQPTTAVNTAVAPAPAPLAATPEAPSTAVASPQTVARLSKPASKSGTPATKTPPPPERAWIELAAIRLARILGSLQLAVTLLSLFAMSVFLGTLMEHWYNTKIAQTLVYKAWWFVVLLSLLTVNICFAAVKKGDFTKLHWPWKKHQAGFLITHVGLLTMLAGGMWHWSAGTDAQMQLIDTNDLNLQAAFKKFYGTISQASGYAIYSDTSILRLTEYASDPHAGVHRAPRQKREVLQRLQDDFEPGPLPWKSENLRGRKDTLLAIMTTLQNPLGRSWALPSTKGARLEVVDFLPHALREAYSPATGKEGVPALKLRLRSARIGRPFEEWVASNAVGGALDVGAGMPIQIELLGTCPEPLLKEFLNPPPPAALGKKGTLVVLGGHGGALRIAVDQAMTGKLFDVPDSSLQVKVVRYLPDWGNRAEAGADDAPADPAVEFQVLEDGRVIQHLQLRARVCDWMRDVARRGAVPQGARGLPLFWFHGPDVRGGKEQIRGVLQFVQTDRNTLHYRSFTQQGEAFALEKAGRLNPEDGEVPVWGKMQWTFRLLEHLPSATDEPRFVPAPVAPGKESDEDKMRYQPAALCRLSAGGKTKEFWVSHQGGQVAAEVDGRQFAVEYTIKLKDLGFEIKLERAEQTVDPGTRAPASYTSYVEVFDSDRGLNGDRRVITMNEPLEYRGYKFYQSSYNFLDTYDANGKPVSVSGFTVGRDPGLGLKYAGSLMLGLGIFTMFYMKAYFFKQRGRALAAAPATNPTEPAQGG